MKYITQKQTASKKMAQTIKFEPVFESNFFNKQELIFLN